MRKTTYICDVCKQETTDSQEVQNQWADVDIKINRQDYRGRNMLLCPDCLKRHGLLKESGEIKHPYQPTIAEELLQLISEIAREAVQE